MTRLAAVGARIRWQHAVLFLFILNFMLAGAGVLWTAQEVGQSQHRWCATLITLDNADRSAPPATRTGRKFATGIRELRHEFGCG